MKRAIVILFSACVGLTNLHSAPSKENSNTKPDAGGVVIEPSEGQIAPGAELTISFPSAMVGADKIDLTDQPCPFVSKPKIEGNFLWKSQTEGVFVVKSVVAGAKHRLALARDLKDVSGKPVIATGWSAEFTATPFTISSDFSEREELNRLPQIPLESSYSVRLSEVAEDVYFHQVIQREPDGRLTRFRDLDVALRDGGAPGAEWRIHFHIPLHHEPTSGFGSTVDHILGVLDCLQMKPGLCSHLEMETYTWEVMPPEFKQRSVIDQLAAEYAWTLKQLAGRGFSLAK